MSAALRSLACNPAAGLALVKLQEHLSAGLGRFGDVKGVTAFDALRLLAEMPIAESERREILQLVAFGSGDDAAAACDMLAALASHSRMADVYRAVGGKVAEGFAWALSRNLRTLLNPGSAAQGGAA